MILRHLQRDLAKARTYHDRRSLEMQVESQKVSDGGLSFVHLLTTPDPFCFPLPRTGQVWMPT